MGVPAERQVWGRPELGVAQGADRMTAWMPCVATRTLSVTTGHRLSEPPCLSFPVSSRVIMVCAHPLHALCMGQAKPRSSKSTKLPM